MAFSMAMPWHGGEEKMHHLLRVPPQDNPTSTTLTPQASFMLQKGSLLALGTHDSQARPWTTLWGGYPGLSAPLGDGLIGTRAFVDLQHDPVVHALVGQAQTDEFLEPTGKGKILAGLAIDLMTRKRVKIAGRMVAGSMQEVELKSDESQHSDELLTKQSQIQLITKVDQSLGNCPKYLNQYQLEPRPIHSKLISNDPLLTADGRALINNSDMFFISTSTENDMDVNHRGGPPGFVRILSPSQIAYPEYSGNRLYQSLGNLQINSKIGITFPDYGTGNVLYITGTAEVLVGIDAASLLPGSDLAVKITISDARFIQSGLPFRGVKKTSSPYNPRVRTLATEGNIKSELPAQSESIVAQLAKKVYISPSIARLTFTVPSGLTYAPGQWVAVDFKSELSLGYEHMRDDDPTSLNDDFVRTFTISSAPRFQDEREKTFDITIRRVGPVTRLLFQQSERVGLEVPILGVGGEFKVHLQERVVTPFIAGGVGITPLLGQLKRLSVAPSRFKLLWTLKMVDVGLVDDVLKQFPELAELTKVFFTGGVATDDYETMVERLGSLGVEVHLRRMAKEDIDGDSRTGGISTWYLCAAKPLRDAVLSWAGGTKVVFENFDY